MHTTRAVMCRACKRQYDSLAAASEGCGVPVYRISRSLEFGYPIPGHDFVDTPEHSRAVPSGGSHRATPVRCFGCDVNYRSQSDAARGCGVSVASVSLMVNGKLDEVSGHRIRRVHGAEAFEEVTVRLIPGHLLLSLDDCLEAMHSLAEWVGDRQPENAKALKTKLMEAHTAVVALRKEIGI
jgi:hypothetical protein